ncbi:MAG: MCE family protein [Bacteroidetes bacterium]|uniref:MCE family protein n=1 Tax=Candidatus Cryptobacteroides gallistercoris TaxID=2840765 RepID=A0A940DMI5_9BACT|nr:MCE family protein [Candidatus Cryptobacteroides gallistercoris]
MKASKELKIGIFVILVLVLSFFVINFLREKDLFNRDIEVSAKYPDVCGLTASAPVYFKGYKAGTVSSIEYDRESGEFLVTCTVDRGFGLSAGTRMVIYSVDLLGGKGVELVPGTSAEILDDGAVIPGETRPDLLASVGDEILPLAGKISSAVDSLNVTVSSINRILGKENRDGLAAAIGHIDRTMANIESISSVIGGRSAEIDGLLANLHEVSASLASVMEKADTAMADIGNVAAALDESDIRGLVTSFRELADSVRDPDGSVGKLLADGGVYDSLESLLADIDSLVRQIEENPKKYIKISLF